MKTFKFLMPFLLVAFTFVGCNTDDLRNDIDELKNRVESLEAQVSAFNDNINALKVLIDGKLTIQEVKEENGVYTLLLSNEQTITLKQGEDFSAPQEPEVTIENGNWVINETETGCPVAGDVPEFRIKDSFWEVKIDGNWQSVKDANGNDVKAVSDGTQTGNSFFESVEYNEAEGVLYIVLKDNSQRLTLPVVQNLVCAINKTSLKNRNTLVVGYGGTANLDVTIKGENAFVTAPSGWIATLSVPDTDGKATLTVKAPAKADASTMSRATADNSKDLTVQVNEGVNWAVDKIQVEAEVVIESYYALYNSGKNFEIAGVQINNQLYPDAKLVDRNDFEFTIDNPLYFIDSSVDVNWTSTANFPNLILIGNNSNVKSKITPTKQIKISSENADGLFLVHNCEIDAQNVMNATGNAKAYLLTQNNDNSFGTVIFDNTKIIALSGQPLTYIYNSKAPAARSIENFIIQNSLLEFPSGTQQQYIISLGSSTATFSNISLVNNIFYSKDLNKLLNKFRIFQGKTANLSNLKMYNNTFVNMATDGDFYVYGGTINTIDVTKNLYYTDVALSNNCGLIKAANTFPTGTLCKDNVVYKISADFDWQVFFGGKNKGFDGAEENIVIGTDPFEGGQFDPTTGIFVPNSTYSGYGATIK